MPAYYNEIDHHAAAWLRELIKAGHIAPGEVDERDMWDVIPEELVHYKQWHFCAGIGTWSHALRLAGWPDSREVLTISLPCQSFSAAGKGAGFDDHRGQLAEAFFWMLDQLRPDVCFGEQVEAALRHDWLDVMATQMEARGYSVGAVSSPACGYGAPHIRQRLYWVAKSEHRRCEGQGVHIPKWEPRKTVSRSTGRGPARLVADAENANGRGGECRAQAGIGENGKRRRGSSSGGNPGILGDSESAGLQERLRPGTMETGRTGATAHPPGPTNGFWADAEWIPCRDGKARPTEPGTFPLAHGAAARVVHSGDQGAPADEIDPQNTAEARVMRLRGYGNAICAPQAVEFIKAVSGVIA